MICSTLEGLWNTAPRAIEKIVPYFGADQQPMSGDEMAARMMMMSRRGPPP